MSTTLLVVDDDDEIRELLCDYLTDAGYNVLAAADGEQMREHRPGTRWSWWCWT
jgi:DNA-binding response OmpR family regulator